MHLFPNIDHPHVLSYLRDFLAAILLKNIVLYKLASYYITLSELILIIFIDYIHHRIIIQSGINAIIFSLYIHIYAYIHLNFYLVNKNHQEKGGEKLFVMLRNRNMGPGTAGAVVCNAKAI